MTFDVSVIRRQFPFLGSKEIAYLDSTATSQKPQAVLDAMQRFYTETNANVNRGVYPLAEAATTAYDKARQTVAAFINAAKAHEIIFTKNATEAINLVARTWGETLKAGDRITLTTMEHHSNIVPWLQLAERKKIEIDCLAINESGQPDLTLLKAILKKGKTKLVALTGLSNVLGSSPPLKDITKLAHEHGALVLIDGSQLVAHADVDVRDIDCDFLTFSGHKVYGPTGIGVLYGKTKLLESMPAFLGGGDMIRSVTMKGFTPAELPRKFEAGTPPTADAIGLAAAIEWMKTIGMEEIHDHEQILMTHAMKLLEAIKGLRILGTTDAKKRKGCISFIIDGVHPHDLTEVLGQKGFCLRAGHHCTQPLHESLGINASARMSFAAYNTLEEIDRVIAALQQAIRFLKK